MPSDAWKLARAASRAAASARAAAVAAAAASRDSPVATAAASRGSAVAARGGSNRPPSRYSQVRDPSAAAPPSTGPSKFNEEAYLPIEEAYRYFSNRRAPGGILFNPDMRSDKKGMPFDVEDLKSEQTLWDLYNRWCSYFNMGRSSVEKGYRFDIFKEKARLIYELKGADPKNLVLNHLCDVGVDELCPPKFFRRRY